MNARTSAAFALALLGSACAGRHQTPLRVEPGLAALVGWTPTEDAYAARTLSEGAAPSDWEIVSTVVPPGTNAACPNGRAFVSFSGTSVIAPFECLDDRSSPQCAAAGGVRAAPFAPQGSMPVYSAEYELGTAICMPSATRTQPRYDVAGTDTDGVRTPTSVLQLKAYYLHVGNDPSHECRVQTPHAVNFVRRSTHCGDDWTYSNVIDATPLGDPNVSGNADFPFLYYDRTSGYVYLLAHTGAYDGGVVTSLVWRSTDDGRSWAPLPRSRMPPSMKALTSVGDGAARAVVAFGCHPSVVGVNDGHLLVYVSYDDGASWDAVPDGVFADAPKCGLLATSADERTATFLAGHTGSFVGHVTNAIAYRRDAAPGSFEVRLAYSWLEPDASGHRDHPRQAIQYGTLSFPTRRGGLAKASWRGGHVLRPSQDDDSFFRAAFTQPWLAEPNAPPVGDTAILWWIEARPSDGTHASGFRTVSGEANFGPVQPMSATRGGTHRWRPNVSCGGIDGAERAVGVNARGRAVDARGAVLPGYWWCFAGDYDRGTSWVDAGGRLHFFHTWAESHAGVNAPNSFLHYNQAIVGR